PSVAPQAKQGRHRPLGLAGGSKRSYAKSAQGSAATAGTISCGRQWRRRSRQSFAKQRCPQSGFSMSDNVITFPELAEIVPAGQETPAPKTAPDQHTAIRKRSVAMRS